MPKVIIVGAGLMGRWHAFSALRSGATITDIVDPNLEKARALQHEFAAHNIYKSLDECLQNNASKHKSNIAHICTPDQNHLESIELCLTHKLHCLVEKPLVSTFEQTKRVLEQANESGLKIAPVHQMPFQSGASRLAANHANLGKIVRMTHTAFTSGGEGKSETERQHVLLEILPHPLSLFYRFFGERLEADQFNVRRYENGELEIDAAVDDSLLRISISLRARPTRNELTVAGDKASAHVDLFHGFCTYESGEVSKRSKILKPFRFGSSLVFDAGRNLVQRSAEKEVAYPGLRNLIRQFYRSALEGKEAPISEREILLCAEIADRVRTNSDSRS
ncbi:MAG: Gfo/Idh/MocA family oxidoreductase [Candidatus Obscuribacterales bacterium]